MKGALELRAPNETMIVLETVQAAKFSPTIRESLNIEPPMPQGFENLTTLPQKVETIENDAQALMDKIEAFLTKLPLSSKA